MPSFIPATGRTQHVAAVCLNRIGKDHSCRAIEGPQGPQRMLSAETLDLLRQWWKVRPSRHDAGTPLEERWLFPGAKRGKTMSTRQLSRLFHEAADAAGLRKGVSLHV